MLVLTPHYMPEGRRHARQKADSLSEVQHVEQRARGVVQRQVASTCPCLVRRDGRVCQVVAA